MANRSYLYACNQIPGTTDEAEKSLIGLSEWNYAIPLAYKILLSSNTQACRSRIWNNGEIIALIGDYNGGLSNLTQFLKRITLAEALPDIENTLEFLNKPSNQARYFLLECGEIFSMDDAEIASQNTLLYKKIQALQNTIEQTLQTINTQALPPAKKRFSIFPSKPEPQPASKDSLRTAAELGLTNWENVLYYHYSA